MLLEVDKIEVGYGDAIALWDLSIGVKPGEIVSVVGPNGAGKSTLVNAIAGILRPHKGKIVIEGNDVSKVPSHRVCDYGIAVVPEGRRLFTMMTVLDNLLLGAYRSVARTERDATLAEVFQLFPILKERQDSLAGSLSGGQQQMVAIGRGLMAKPRVLLMDEPSLGLSPLIVGEMFKIIQMINERGVAVLLVEQNVNKALEIAHQAYVIEQGRVTASGAPEVLINDPSIREAYLGI
ncbi:MULTISPECIES: ABC transporter ATP-binding protein [Rhizobium]|jgi:branched-chain amino acid transport system ATP-binding protein|uniref:ABC transporter ATP-binding protein n=1 Tax=Rhizobium TaxID=379 RepID=UPI0006459734|nr:MULTISPECIES: ABC transporter ATP-binding protein [Rhizobium]KZS56486.1 ABC transporter ATP-binding protein [Rhizobium anhuiense bv. trifolii]MBB3302327.1 branched-chain amino acid transport system ATP-binding protein [Rhizobium sp. BK112]MBB3371539.1 branched-chain amino acid transport system ATP-binding protein [Rhizobium sp. BK077]MBB3746548.1 branched-chain amino acid transport system ATP-binding protein [Rhizobium sp. BK591]MBB4117208.1 branched-chain amino acid transport system ATP-bi